VRTILYPPTAPWEWMRQRPHHLLARAARSGYRVLWVEDQPKPGRPAVREAEPNLLVVNDAAALPGLIQGELGVYISSPLSLVQLPGLTTAARCLVFDYIDRFPQWEPHVERALRTAQVVLASSDELWRRALASRRDAHLVPNGVEYRRFSEPAPEPFDLSLVPRPVAMYTGAVGDWVDSELLLALAEALPEVSFVVVGPHLNASFLDRFPWPANLWCLGHRPYEEIPGYLQAGSVLLLPFPRGDAISEATNPCKLWEYLATGRPVVATPIPEVRSLGELGVVRLARDADSFVAAVQAALAGDDRVEQRRAVARDNDWDRRWEVVRQPLEEAWSA